MTPPAHEQDYPFVDAHVHIRDASGLDCAAAAGVVAVRDAGMHLASPAGTRILFIPHKPPLIVVSSGWAIYKKGGYGSFFGVPVETRKEITSEIAKLKRAGAGIIKIMASGMVSLRDPGKVTTGGFDRDDLAWIVAEADSHGLEVMAHVNGEQAIIDASEAGVRSVEHGFFMTTRALEELASKKTFWVPTIGALKRAVGSAHASQEVIAFVDGLVHSQLEMIGHARAVGVPLAVGTDCVLPDPGYKVAYDAELAYFEQAGLPVDEVKNIACEGGARLLGI